MLSDDDKWYSVSLRLEGDKLDPFSVEQALGLPPTTIGRTGERRKGKDGRLYAPYETNIWIYSLPSSTTTPFNTQLEGLFATLGSRIEALAALCKGEGVSGVVFLGFGSGCGQGGDTISPDVLAQLARAGLFLCLDLYPPSIDEEVSEPAGADQPATRSVAKAP